MGSKLVTGNHFADTRGILTFNNDFDASAVKRIYFIENKNPNFVRAWQGHRIEQRWFSAVRGSFEIKIISIDNWDRPSSTLHKETIILSSENFSILHIPNGNVTSIQALEENSKLMVFSDYLMGQVQDEYRYSSDYFK